MVMSFPTLEKYPGLVSNFLLYPHGRRMLSAFMYLPHREAAALAPIFFDAYKKMEDGPNKEQVSNLMTGNDFHSWNGKQLMDNKMATFSQESCPDAMWTLNAVSEFSTPDRDFFGLTVIDLASPQIPAAILEDIFNREETTNAAKTAMTANPNFPEHLTFTPADDCDWVRGLALAKYGDLTSEKNIAELKERFTDPNIRMRDDLAIGYLCARKEIPEELAEQLHMAIKPEFFPLLAQTEGHRAMVRRKIKADVPIQTFTPTDIIYVSPEMDTKTLDAIYEHLDSHGDEGNKNWAKNMAMVACHPNASAEITGKALFDKKVLPEMEDAILAMKSHVSAALLMAVGVKQGLMRYGSLAKVPDCPPSTLSLAFDACRTKPCATGEALIWKDEDVLALAAHKNFPWDKYSFDAMDAAVTTPDSRFAMFCCMSLGSRYRDIDEFYEGKYAAASLFNQRTSTVRLQKLVSQDPELAAWAAMHPNAGGEIKGLRKDLGVCTSAFAEKFHSPGLAGKSAGKKDKPSENPFVI